MLCPLERLASVANGADATEPGIPSRQHRATSQAPVLLDEVGAQQARAVEAGGLVRLYFLNMVPTVRADGTQEDLVARREALLDQHRARRDHLVRILDRPRRGLAALPPEQDLRPGQRVVLGRRGEGRRDQAGRLVERGVQRWIVSRR
jgi:hypothetical protein